MCLCMKCAWVFCALVSLAPSGESTQSQSDQFDSILCEVGKKTVKLDRPRKHMYMFMNVSSTATEI